MRQRDNIFDDVALRELTVCLDRFYRIGKKTCGSKLQEFIEFYVARHVSDSDRNTFKEIYNKRINLSTKSAKTNAYLGEVTSPAPTGVPELKNMDLPVKEETFVEAPVVGNSDLEIVERYGDVFKYTNATQIHYHFGKGKKMERYVSTDIKAWAKAYDDTLWKKIRMVRANKNIVACQRVFDYLVAKGVMENYTVR